MRDAATLVVLGVGAAVLAYDAYTEVRFYPWWMIGLGAALTIWAAVWQRRKASKGGD